MAYIQIGKTKVQIVNTSENDGSDANVSQYPVESGAPITDNMMYMGGQVTISGLLLADSSSKAEQAYKTLVDSQKNVNWITYRGRIYLKDAVIQSISRSYATYENGFDVSITLQPMRLAKSVWEKIPQPPVAKQPVKPSSAVYVTVQPGNTYWGWWMQYGTAIQTLRDWNKWPDRFIPIGARARVK
ncbi:peptidoglycan-binding protein LysM [Enterococcus plantarum]|uniref:Peptidoglycan-binding protein LysM n=1 Tax=Enterococcus plantarum TaxID=1077675 RepID=A0A2W4BW69_9ENTE|nr:LysM peptidoglycan-binding domain-containing protein [Enterococcus plantarum]PZL78252.1 peptidoglycan-binding protein LysM [Enterococcus plantarum]